MSSAKSSSMLATLKVRTKLEDSDRSEDISFGLAISAFLVMNGLWMVLNISTIEEGLN